ncbi:MAG: hypothetical protein K1X88_02430 [Nannocystaceae bacterium]|nr:hypothetical protein [Nannocystaceae bacterium]
MPARLRFAALVAALLAALLAAPAARADAPADPPQPAVTRIGAFIVALADLNEAQRRFDITLWLWLISPQNIGAIDPAKTLEITNAVTTERQHAVTTATPAGRWSQVKFRAQVRNPLDFGDFPFDRHTLQLFVEDAERDTRQLVFVPDTPPEGRAPLTLSQDLSPSDWTISDLALTVAPHAEATNFGDPSQTTDAEFSRATLSITITRRHSLRILLTLLLGTFMGSAVAFFAVMLPVQQAPPRYTLLSGALFVSIANRLLVDARLPPGSSLGLLDQLQLLAIVGLVVLTGASLVLTNLAEKRIPLARATVLSQRLGILWLGGLLSLQALLVALR